MKPHALSPLVPFRALGNILGLAAALVFLHQAQAQSTLPFYEPFPSTYNENETLGTAGLSGNIWTYGNSVSSSSARIVSAGALAYPGLTTDATSRGLRSNGAGKNRGAPFTAQNNVTMYASFLLNVLTNGTGNRSILALSASTSGTGPIVNAGVWIDSNGRLMISKNSSTTPAVGTTYPLVLSNTYLVVLRYKVNTGSSTDDEVALWLNPSGLGDNAAVPAPTLTTTANNDNAAIASVAFMEPSSAPVPLFYMDEIRVSTNWDEVTPVPCTPGAIFAVTGGGSGCSGSGFPVGLSGSEAGVDYWLWANGVFSGTVVSGNGSALTFGNQTTTAYYSVMASNITSSCLFWMTGSVYVANQTFPAIVSQPLPAGVVAGFMAVFSVSATGDGLTYQWRRDGTNLIDGGNISGVTTSNLVITAASAADVAGALDGYDVVVSGVCNPPAVSSRVGLSLVSASSLVWSGDGAANAWDVGVTANWNANAAAFHNGDQVTFNDTTANITVALANNYLNPSSILVDSAQAYVFSGSGALTGPNTRLMMNGPGTLALNNGNSYGGGTTITNGLVSFGNASALGTGPITLAGGILSALNVQGITLWNAVNVYADSIIRINNTSTSALILTNTLGGTAGTLIFNNNTSGRGPTIQLTYPGFTFNRPIILDLGVSGTNLFLSGNNGSGSQVFNGDISGGGTVRRNASGGSTVLNAGNTYFGGTLLSNGSIGVGRDSVSISPPTIDNGPLGTGLLYIDVGSGTPALFASGGAHTVGNPVMWMANTFGPPFVISGSNNLTLSGAVDLSGTNRVIQVNNTALTTLSGPIGDQGLANGLVKTGTNTLVLSATNTYTGATIVGGGTLVVNGQLDIGGVTVTNGGTLGGTGTILGPVAVLSGGTLAPGASIGTLTINNSLLLQGGNTAVEINKTAGTSDLVRGLTSVTYGGALTVNNLAGTLTTNDTFKIFDAASYAGTFASISPQFPETGLTWNTNTLATDGILRLMAAAGPNPSRTNISFSVSGSTLTLTWPTDHTGWLLQTNSVGVADASQWFPLPGSDATNQVILNILPGRSNVFFRLQLTVP